MKDELKLKIISESKCIEEDALYSFKGHFNAAALWEKVHFWLGISTTVLSTIAGATIFAKSTGNWNFIAGSFGLIAGILAAVSTFIAPHKRVHTHRLAGSDYQLIRNMSRLLYEVKVMSNCSSDSLIEELEKLREKQSTLSKEHPTIPNWAFKNAQSGINDGEAKYQAS